MPISYGVPSLGSLVTMSAISPSPCGGDPVASRAPRRCVSSPRTGSGSGPHGRGAMCVGGEGALRAGRSSPRGTTPTRRTRRSSGLELDALEAGSSLTTEDGQTAEELDPGPVRRVAVQLAQVAHLHATVGQAGHATVVLVGAEADRVQRGLVLAGALVQRNDVVAVRLLAQVDNRDAVPHHSALAVQVSLHHLDAADLAAHGLQARDELAVGVDDVGVTLHGRDQLVHDVQEVARSGLGGRSVSGEHLGAGQTLGQTVELLGVGVVVTVDEAVLELVRRGLDLHRGLDRALVVQVAPGLLNERVDIRVATQDVQGLGLLVDRAGRRVIALVHRTERDARKGLFLVVGVGVALNREEGQTVEDHGLLDKGLQDAALQVILRKFRGLGQADRTGQWAGSSHAVYLLLSWGGRPGFDYSEPLAS